MSDNFKKQIKEDIEKYDFEEDSNKVEVYC